MRLTGAGERMLSWARRLLDQAEQARREVTGQRQALRLGALETIAATYMPRVLGRLAERRPGLRVEVRTSASRDDLLADVAAGRLEAAMLLDTGDVLGDLGFPAPPEPLAFLDVDAVPLVLVAANDHPLLGRPRLTPADLAGERLLVNVPNCSFFMAADKVFGGSPERVHAGAVSVMRTWTEQGLGIALLPEFAVSTALKAGTLERLDFPDPGPEPAARLARRPRASPRTTRRPLRRQRLTASVGSRTRRSSRTTSRSLALRPVETATAGCHATTEFGSSANPATPTRAGSAQRGSPPPELPAGAGRGSARAGNGAPTRPDPFCQGERGDHRLGA